MVNQPTHKKNKLLFNKTKETFQRPKIPNRLARSHFTTRYRKNMVVLWWSNAIIRRFDKETGLNKARKILI